MRETLNAIGRVLPQSAQNIGLSIYNSLPIAAKYGKHYLRTQELLNISQYWDTEQHEAYQLASLQALIKHAYTNVPFYYQLYSSQKIKPDDIRSLADLKLLPFITKDTIQNNLSSLKAQNLPESAFQYHTTGGSTGKPVGLYWEANRTVPMERAFIHRQWTWAGFNPSQDRAIILRGTPTTNNRLYESVGSKQLRLSTYDLTSDNIDLYIKIIQEYRPVSIQAYPSAAYIFAQHILQCKIRPLFPSLRVILCGSENLYPWQREAISNAFGCRIFSWYGQSEYVALAGECEYSTKYHVYSEYGITEVLDEQGFDALPGRTGEIIATGFNNRSMPLIRYRTNDIAKVSLGTRCSCGRQYSLIESIEGRLQEMAISKKGNLVSMTAINMHDGTFDNVYQFQFYQETPGILILNLVPKEKFRETDEKKILSSLEKKLKDQFDIQIQRTTEIEKTERGKARFLVQKLQIGDFEN